MRRVFRDGDILTARYVRRYTDTGGAAATAATVSRRCSLDE